MLLNRVSLIHLLVASVTSVDILAFSVRADTSASMFAVLRYLIVSVHPMNSSESELSVILLTQVLLDRCFFLCALPLCIPLQSDSVYGTLDTVCH